MAIKRPDIYEHNNPNYAIADSNFVRGGIRSAVADLTALYALAPKLDQLKEHSTIVYVSGETKYYVLVDIANVGNVNGWNEFQTGSGSGTITGGTNGLSTLGANIILGGTLLSGTTIDANNNDFSITNITDFQITTSGDSTILGVDNDGLLFSFTGGSITFDDNGGIKYGGNYRTNFTEYSLVDAGYVTGLTNQINERAITGATNGLSIGDLKVGLGGNLTGDTIIDGLDSHSLDLNNLTQFGITTSGTSIIFNDSDGFRYGSPYTSTSSNWLTTKTYVDSVALGLILHEAVRVATTGNTVLSGLTTVDGISLNLGDRILVKNQVDETTNGVYSASTGSWGRTSDFDFNITGETRNGDLFPVTTGDTQYNTLWAITTKNPIESGDTIQFTLFSRPNTYLSGIGIDISGNIINVDGANLDGNSILWSGNTFNVDISSGTLSTALGSKLNETIFTTYTGNTKPILDNAITGATNLGSGTTIYSTTNNRNLELYSITGSGSTTVQKVGNEIIINSIGTGGGNQIYSGETPTAIDLGGIDAGYVLTGKTISCIIQDLLVPELCGTITDPSTSISLTRTGVFEIGCVLSQVIVADFSRGSIDPQYDSISQYRSGAANGYYFTGSGMSTNIQLIASANTAFSVPEGSTTWGVCTRYDAGSPALSNKGNEFCAALPSGCTLADTASITGIYPWYWGTSSSPTVSGTDVANGNKCIAVVNQSTPICFDANAEYLWFAALNGTTPKTKWWVCSANAACMLGDDSIWQPVTPVGVISAEGCWSGTIYDLYVTRSVATTDIGTPMCLYY